MRRLDANVVVIGAGPAGIAAAVRASQRGACVLVVDQNTGPGGQIWRGVSSSLWLRLFRRANLDRLFGAQLVSADTNARALLVETSETALEVRYDKLILATGARELFLPFPNWTLPGVMGVGGLQAMVRSGMPVRGKRVVVAGSGPLLLAVAAHLRLAGATVALVAEQASADAVSGFLRTLFSRPGKLAQGGYLRAALAGVQYRFGCWVERAEGRDKLEGVMLREGDRVRAEHCDFAAVAYGLHPNTETAELLGCAVEHPSGIATDHEQQTTVPDIYAAGECTGIGGVDLSLAEGQIAGYAACGELHRARYLLRVRDRARSFAGAMKQAFTLRPELKNLSLPETIVCRCEDVTYSELAGLPSFRAAKLHTRCGMGPCQARVCGPATGFLFAWSPDSVRPPLFPARLTSLIGSEP